MPQYNYIRQTLRQNGDVLLAYCTANCQWVKYRRTSSAVPSYCYQPCDAQPGKKLPYTQALDAGKDTGGTNMAVAALAQCRGRGGVGGGVKFAGQTVPAMWTRAKVGATVSAHWARSPVDSPSASSHGRQRPAQEIIQHLSSGPPAGKGQTNFCGRMGGKNCTGPKMCSPAH